ncbi:hypothetical protein OQH61_01175 [Helicobacter sp. MIT 21-1697]|uniref:hypothetical protein n=1 Tax=Helicobacter sp. MIT 21-1697 TaxID=2993733 RepID=UPI00224A6F9E|nr:hypothetical protein [Helicobacter sp. MIT 21-1697]MCX2716352.1 hypothetical protein [Helicobacter sp. MIT 21-1697]
MLVFWLVVTFANEARGDDNWLQDEKGLDYKYIDVKGKKEKIYRGHQGYNHGVNVAYCVVNRIDGAKRYNLQLDMKKINKDCYYKVFQKSGYFWMLDSMPDDVYNNFMTHYEVGLSENLEKFLRIYGIIKEK